MERRATVQVDLGLEVLLCKHLPGSPSFNPSVYSIPIPAHLPPILVLEGRTVVRGRLGMCQQEKQQWVRAMGNKSPKDAGAEAEICASLDPTISSLWKQLLYTERILTSFFFF